METDVQAPGDKSRKADIFLGARCKNTLCSFHENADCFSYCLVIGMGKNIFARSAAAYQVPGAVLICSVEEATSGSLTAIVSSPELYHFKVPLVPVN